MIRRWLVLCGLLLNAVSIAACGGSTTPTHHGTARPLLAQNLTVSTCSAGSNHTMGECLPHPKLAPLHPVKAAGIHCVDLSNNDPVFGVGAYRVMAARGIRCLIVKVTEGTGFIDRTAARMARDAKAAGLVVGGYGFQHVCGDSASGEGRLFAIELRADGLLGKRTIAPEADVEFGNARCGAVAWEMQWRRTVAGSTGRAPGTYTGAWFWNPTFGNFWPDSWAWISGFGVRFPSTPSGHSHVDMWQNTDAGFNGVTSADESVFLDGSAAFNKFASIQPPKPKPTPTAWQKQWNTGFTRGYDVHWLRIHHRKVPPTTLKFTKVVQQGYDTGYRRVH